MDEATDGCITELTENSQSPGINHSKKWKEHGICSDKLSDCKRDKWQAPKIVFVQQYLYGRVWVYKLYRLYEQCHLNQQTSFIHKPSNHHERQQQSQKPCFPTAYENNLSIFFQVCNKVKLKSCLIFVREEYFAPLKHVA